MNKDIANYMKGRLASLPFIDFIAGLVQTVEYSDPVSDESGQMVTKRMPVAYDTNAALCENESPEKALIPDSSKKGILYFEDGGVRLVKKVRHMNEMRSTLTAVCWLNREVLVGNNHAEISTACMTAIINSFGGNPVNHAPFTRMKFEAAQILPQDKAVFSKYTYDEKITQYLRPPFEFFAIVFNVDYHIAPDCVESFYDDILQNNPCAL